MAIFIWYFSRERTAHLQRKYYEDEFSKTKMITITVHDAMR